MIPSIARRCWFYNLGLVPYTQAWAIQQSLVAERLQNPDLEDVLILLEHPPVYTLGQGATLNFLKFDPNCSNWEVYRVERGGEVTYHCPGQLVGYPILNLRRHRPDLHWYLRQLEEVLIQVLAFWGLEGSRLPGLTGVWHQGRKVAAIGIKVSRWITMHGFALNVCPNLQGFQRIVPCGISDQPVGSLAEFIPDVDINAVRRAVATAFSQVFDLQLIELEFPLLTQAAQAPLRARS
ncbi:MAG: lipoyl(octanoyl) transferase LipB [Oscillatoriaceae bacterium SKW80]|nr:lipoyl(octanoyl) transferase LipB [Oscillatoriaceae bacterium SKYG93]MCX8119451.1 lipoyl(octanoyl) transferase LipB [Oscillatoriaceae bacterium SKW80]MDW8454917.1 lipoyl(octanoyl) transferase LipB [Oscillatoriaceae cyanobacterium SKYGB_i_bin93]HIK28304.1 lipoyl(octanoyl) transferase LipB [Oscillatoriaceae cyanobacterium M7585_C2015_266]